MLTCPTIELEDLQSLEPVLETVTLPPIVAITDDIETDDAADTVLPSMEEGVNYSLVMSAADTATPLAPSTPSKS